MTTETNGTKRPSAPAVDADAGGTQNRRESLENVAGLSPRRSKKPRATAKHVGMLRLIGRSLCRCSSCLDKRTEF